MLEPPHPPTRPTKPCWPTRAIGASALRYVGIVRREKVIFSPDFRPQLVTPSPTPKCFKKSDELGLCSGLGFFRGRLVLFLSFFVLNPTLLSTIRLFRILK